MISCNSYHSLLSRYVLGRSENMASWTREKLYEQIWTKPISMLAPTLGISEACLKKACAEAHIPTPGRVHWAKRRAGLTQDQIALPTRPAGMSENVVLGGTQFSWLQNLSDAEVLQWPETPSSFPDDLAIVRQRVRQDLGRIDVPTNLDGAHSEIRRLLRTDAGRLERERRTSVKFPWAAPRFESALGQRQLRILNALFLGVSRAGGKGQVGGGDRLETSVVVHGSPVAFRLSGVVPEATKSRRRTAEATDKGNRLRLAILDVHGPQLERFAWQDDEGLNLEALVTDIAVELITTAEINYRDACLRRHIWISERRDTLAQHLEKERQVAEVAAQNQTLALAKARRDELLGMATDYRQARTIRLFVAALRLRSSEGDGSCGEAFEDWCRWAVAEADKLDPAKNLTRFIIPVPQT